MPASSAEHRFGTTRWSLVAAAGDQDPATARASLATLCLRYWYPVYAYLRRSGHRPEAAQQLAHGFFQHLLSLDLAQSDATRHGRFRQFLQAELHRFLSTARPGEGMAQIPDAPTADELERKLAAEPGDQQSPEQLLCRGFALELLAAARAQLRREAMEAGRLDMFEALERFLGQEPRPGELEASAGQLGLATMSVALAVRRLRQRFRELVDRELCETLAAPAELEAEREILARGLGSP